MSGITKAEREAREWLRLNAWVSPEQKKRARAAPSIQINGLGHVENLLKVIEGLREGRRLR